MTLRIWPKHESTARELFAGADLGRSSNGTGYRAQANQETRVPEDRSIVTLRLTGHLTRDALLTAFFDLESDLRGRTNIHLLVDALAMTGYDQDARTEFTLWNRVHRQQIHAVAIAVSNIRWRTVIAAMSLASGQQMKAVATVEDGIAWLQTREPALPDSQGIHCDMPIGRLVELRVRRVDREELEQMLTKVLMFAGRIAPRKLVVCSDLRTAPTLSPDMYTKASSVLVSIYKHVEREAVILPVRSPVIVNQIHRQTDELSLKARRLCTEPAHAMTWLGETLNRKEQQRLRAFLHGE